MDLVFVVPGIMGSELYLGGDRIWPPKMLRKMPDPDRLLHPDVKIGDIIRNVLVFGFYEKLLEPLDRWGYREGKPGRKGLVIPWPYNWVRGIPENAQRLAGEIRRATQDHPDKAILLLAHSMGGLVCTYALECLTEKDSSWRERVRLFVTFGTPFRGAPESLKNAFGVEGVMGITGADCQRLMADPRFPSAYQLLPHLSTLAAWSSQPPLHPLPDYQSLYPAGPALGTANLDAAIACQQALKDGSAAVNVRKFNFCGNRHRTIWSVGTPQDHDDILDPYETKAGDGTVPSWSGRHDHTVQFAPLGAKHSTTFGDDDVLEVLHDLLATSTPPKGPGSGSGSRLTRQPPPSPQLQPRVSVTKNAISSLSTHVEIEVLEPPQDGTLYLAWVRLENVETTDDIAQFLRQAEFNTLSAQHVLAMASELEFPQHISIPRPPDVGQYALAAWSQEHMRSIDRLEVSRMDAVWVFVDQHKETTRGGSVIAVDAPDAPLITATKTAQRDAQELAMQSMKYSTAE